MLTPITDKQRYNIERAKERTDRKLNQLKPLFFMAIQELNPHHWSQISIALLKLMYGSINREMCQENSDV